jgi:hypothetical protein
MPKIGQVFIFVLFMLPLSLFARPLTQDEMLRDFNQLTSSVRSSYGPLEFKQQEMGISIDELEAAYTKKIEQITSNSDFYYLIVQFVAEFKDSHFSARIPTDHSATLGFSTEWLEGKVIINSMNRGVLPETSFPFEVGDEILRVDGVAIIELLAELRRHINAGNSLTADRMAAWAVANRNGAVVPVPKGDVNVVVRPRLQPWVEKEVTLAWIESGEPLDENKDYGKEEAGFRSLVANEPSFAEAMNLSIAKNLAELKGGSLDRDYSCNGTTRIKIPADAHVIMTEPFVAYYHTTDRGQIGYLRIPHYMPINSVTGAFEPDRRFDQYEYAISVLEENTVGLIIDQDHNCGGSVTFLEDLLGLFFQKSTDPMAFRLLASKNEYLTFKGWQSGLSEHSLRYLFFQNIIDSIKASWQADEFLTSQTLALGGKKSILPHQVQYTKPILMLIDEMSGSGGDAFPAMMQGHGRAKLLGTRTMGAGGHVVQTPPLFYSGINVRLTKSLFYRPDGVPVENNGAVPDVEYSHTVQDHLDGYTAYQALYLKTLLSMID